MKRICPNPMPWHEAVERLAKYALLHTCTPLSPPAPLILAGWVYSNDLEKMKRWEETVVWADNSGCNDLVSAIPERDFYCIDCPTTYAVGPMGGPMNRPWDFETKNRPASKELTKHMDILLSRWPEIVGQKLTSITRPVAFTGAKARRLLVFADAAAMPPWGAWASLSTQEPERRTFTDFRSAINAAIAPHAVDHIDFTTELSGAK